MMHWLAAWLQQIIAVVLLAGFIDLILPNKGMQRYVRLVAGLIILLTILTPIIRVLQGDFSAKLDAEIGGGWLDADPAKSFRMPTLEDIESGAKALQEKETASAAELAEKRIADAMKSGIGQATGLQVASVELSVATGKDGKPGQLKGVSVTLSPPQDAEQSATSEAGQSTPQAGAGTAGGDDANAPVRDVDAVEVTVEPQEGEIAVSGGPEETKPAANDVAAAVKSVLKEGWSVNPAIVQVLEQAPDKASER